MKKLFSVLLLCVIIVMGMFGFAGCGDPFNDDELGRDEVENKVTIRFGYRRKKTSPSSLKGSSKNRTIPSI